MNLEIRKIDLSDCDELLQFELQNQFYFTKFIPPRPDGYLSAAGIENSIDILIAEMDQLRGAYYLLRRDQVLIGRFNFEIMEDGEAELGYRIAEQHTGRGIATIGLGMALEKVQHDLDISKIHAQTTPQNIGSHRVLEKCGFNRCGIKPDGAIFLGEKVDLVQFERHFM